MASTDMYASYIWIKLLFTFKDPGGSQQGPGTQTFWDPGGGGDSDEGRHKSRFPHCLYQAGPKNFPAVPGARAILGPPPMGGGSQCGQDPAPPPGPKIKKRNLIPGNSVREKFCSGEILPGKILSQSLFCPGKILSRPAGMGEIHRTARSAGNF